MKPFYGYLLYLWKCLPSQMCPCLLFFSPQTFYSFTVSAWKPSLWDRPTICQSRGSLAREWSPLSFTGALSEHVVIRQSWALSLSPDHGPDTRQNLKQHGNKTGLFIVSILTPFTFHSFSHSPFLCPSLILFVPLTTSDLWQKHLSQRF